MFFQQLPAIVENSLLIKHLDAREIMHHVQTIVNQEFMKKNLTGITGCIIIWMKIELINKR